MLMKPVLTPPKLLIAIAVLASLLSITSRRLHDYRIRDSATDATVAADLSQIETCAYPNFRTGIETPETIAFLDWAASLGHHIYCRADLNQNGDIVRVATDICWAPPDSELKVIAELPHLQTIVFYSGRATDKSLEYFAGNPSIKRIQTYGRRQFTPAGYARFTARRPDITMTF